MADAMWLLTQVQWFDSLSRRLHPFVVDSCVYVCIVIVRRIMSVREPIYWSRSGSEGASASLYKQCGLQRTMLRPYNQFDSCAPVI